jgi:hypothetical protein
MSAPHTPASPTRQITGTVQAEGAAARQADRRAEKRPRTNGNDIGGKDGDVDGSAARYEKRMGGGAAAAAAAADIAAREPPTKTMQPREVGTILSVDLMPRAATSTSNATTSEGSSGCSVMEEYCTRTKVPPLRPPPPFVLASLDDEDFGLVEGLNFSVKLPSPSSRSHDAIMKLLLVMGLPRGQNAPVWFAYYPSSTTLMGPLRVALNMAKAKQTEVMKTFTFAVRNKRQRKGVDFCHRLGELYFSGFAGTDDVVIGSSKVQEAMSEAGIAMTLPLDAPSVVATACGVDATMRGANADAGKAVAAANAAPASASSPVGSTSGPALSINTVFVTVELEAFQAEVASLQTGAGSGCAAMILWGDTERLYMSVANGPGEHVTASLPTMTGTMDDAARRVAFADKIPLSGNKLKRALKLRVKGDDPFVNMHVHDVSKAAGGMDYRLLVVHSQCAASESFTNIVIPPCMPDAHEDDDAFAEKRALVEARIPKRLQDLDVFRKLFSKRLSSAPLNAMLRNLPDAVDVVLGFNSPSKHIGDSNKCQFEVALTATSWLCFVFNS